MSWRRILGVLVLASLMLPFLVAWQFLERRIFDVKKEIHDRINAEEIEPDVLLKFTPVQSAQLAWEHDREFMYQGMMYDIICSEMFNDTIWYWCHLDIKESTLKRKLNNLLVNGVDSAPLNQDHNKQLTHFFKTLFFVSSKAATTAYLSSSQEILFAYADQHYVSPGSSPPAPPPENI